MSRPAVFISYSHRDEKLLGRLLPYLESLQREKLAEIWADTKIEGGDRWRDEIEQALNSASIAVLLISQSFLASRFVYEEELPRIFRRQSEGVLVVLPVFLSPSTVTSTTIQFTDKDGFERAVALSDFQGFGTPDKTIKELPAIERDRRFLKLHNRLRELARSLPAKPTAGQPRDGTPQPPGLVSGSLKSDVSEIAAEAPFLAPKEDISETPLCFPPAGVILDRQYAYTLTSYSNDLSQRGAAELSQKYDELFDVLTCSILLFDEIYLEQHHVSSLDSNLDRNEAEAFATLFTPFSLSEELGSSQQHIALQSRIKRDLEDPQLTPLLASYYGRRPVRAEHNRELLIYLNSILQRAGFTGAALFVRPTRMPLFHYKLRSAATPEGHDAAAAPFLTLQIPGRRCRSLDQLAALRLDPARQALRGAVSERVRRWTEEQVRSPVSSEASHELETLAAHSDFIIEIRLELLRLPSDAGACSYYFLVSSR